MAAYDTTTYLLDRANISDVCMRLVHYYDTFSTGGEAGLRDRVFAGTVSVDYTAFGFAPPRDFTREEWVREIGRLVGTFKATQHSITGLVIDLPQPGPSSKRPSVVEVAANATGTLVKEGKTEHNGGRYQLELVRDPVLQEKGLNPWRIRKHVAIRAW
ncbi:hypothetical protein VUR80DRAFT_5469 [Thermomyces stellatus]